jgi:DNA-directed RNA polymerase specialized sigma54-like protein
MKHLQIPLSDTEEAVLQLMQRVNLLETENAELKETIKRLQWSLQEHD